MTYQQHLASAMVCLGDNDEAGALASFQAALAEARRIDPDGPREAEVQNYLAQFHQQAGREAEGRLAQEKADAIFGRFQ